MATKSIIRKNVPNFSQASVIAADLIRVRDNENPGATLNWTGNSYGGSRDTAIDGTPVYVLTHWNSVIAVIYFNDDIEKLVVSYFNARHISTTTRGFQSRILKALDKVGVWGKTAVSAELAKPTHKRGILIYDADTATHTTI